MEKPQKNKTRMLGSGAILLIILLPNITLAAWYNPFSWRIFDFLRNKNQDSTEVIKDSQTQIEDIAEEDVKFEKELEKKDSITSVKKPIVLKTSPTQDVNVSTESDLISEIDSWDEYSVVTGGVVTIPNYAERISRVKNLCDYIEKTLKPNLGDPYTRHQYCSIGMHTTVTANTNISISVDYLSYMENTKASKKMTMNAWNLVLDFERAKTLVYNPVIESKKLDRERREAPRPGIIRSSNSNPQTQSSSTSSQGSNATTSGLNCANYSSEKTALDNYHAQNGTLFSSSRTNAMAALDAKYATCF